MSPSAPEEPGGEADARLLFGLFSFLLALSLVLHQLWWNGFDPRYPIVILAALWVLVRPASVVRLSVLLGAEVVAVALDMPDVGDHILLVALCGACVLAYGATRALSARRLPDPGGLFVRIAPFLRISVLVVYAAAALSKMNSGFLDPVSSCAGVMTARIPWLDLSLLGSLPVQIAIWGTVAIEASLPVLLALRRTRPVGLVLGVAFHLVLALAGNVPFAAVMLALYVAFLPADAPSRVRAALAERPGPAEALRRLRPRRRLEPIWFGALIGCWLAGELLASSDPSLAEALLEVGTRLVVVAVVVVAAALGLAVRGRGRGSCARAPGSLRGLHPIFVAGVLLLVLNGLSPYLGLKSATSFNMFSNLRTEAGHWNHAFIPEAVRIFPYQDQVVRVLQTDDPLLQRWADDGYMLVEAELERNLRQRPGAYATYTRSSPEPGRGWASASSSLIALPRHAPALTIGGTSAGQSLTQSLIDKVAKFRPVPAPGAPAC